MARKSVAIVGGGYLGCELAKALEDDLDVTLIEPRKAFIHAPAMIRTLVQPELFDQAMIPYDSLLMTGRVVHARAEAVDATGVQLLGGDRVDADFIVLATGSSNGTVFKPDGDDVAAFRTAQSDLHERIKWAKSIAIVGAGAVGTELAGEIAHAMPGKSVTLVSSDRSLFPAHPPRLGKLLLSRLQKLGVQVILGTRATDLKDLRGPSAGSLTLSDGQTMTADLIIPAIGARPKTELLIGLPGAALASGGRIKVDAHLRPSNLPNVFAAGDVVDTGDAATIVAISRQHPWLAKTLKALAAGKSLSEQAAYTPWTNAPILVPLGPQRGASYLSFATFGDWVTRQMKGKDLFVPKYRKLFGQS